MKDRLRMFEKTVLAKIFALKRDREIKQRW
jgi:hypothetical protein